MLIASFRFIKDLHKMAIGWILWVHFLAMINILGGIYYIDTIIGKTTIICMVFSFILMTFIYSRFGFVRLLGLGHFIWFFLIVFIFFKMSVNLEKLDHYNIWLFMLLFVNSLSLILDVNDVIKYFGGDKKPTI